MSLRKELFRAKGVCDRFKFYSDTGTPNFYIIDEIIFVNKPLNLLDRYLILRWF